MIRIETSQGHVIDCSQRADLVDSEVRGHNRLVAKYQHAVLRTGASSEYNCHGLTFISRRAWVTERKAIDLVLDDDGYDEIKLKDTIPGDIVIYFSDTGDPNHSGLVVEGAGSLLDMRVCSKWAYAGEFVHGLHNCPSEYGPTARFFRCTR